MQLKLIWFSVLMTVSLVSAADVPKYHEEPLDLANYDIASLYKLNKDASFELIGKELNNKTAMTFYSAPGQYRLTFPVYLESYNEEVWLQIRGEQTFNSVLLNGQIISNEYKPLARILLDKSTATKGENQLSIDFTISEQNENHIYRDILLTQQSSLHNQSLQFGIASISYGVLFAIIGILLVCVYFAFFHHWLAFYGAIFYCVSAVSSTLVGLFWLDELSFYVYGSAIDVLDFIIGMSFLLLNLSFVDCPRLQKISIIMVAGLISTLSSYPSFFVFSCVAFFAHSFIYFKQISFFLIALVFATLLATSVDTFNLLDAYIKNVSSLVVRSFLYQLDYFALSLFALYLVKLCFGEWRARGLQNNKLLLQQKNFEIQLIQKHIQPHFLMNALMSVQQQIENSPSDAIEMIDLLSRDFQLLHKQMGKTLIPLNDEIAICEGLCGLMGKSQVAHYSLALSGHDLPIEIPPGLLFTLIENGIKHGYSGRKDGQFFITISIKNKVLSIFVENDGLSKKVTNSNGGFGLHYIREQLDFWKPKQWSFEAGPSDLGWKNAIKITHFDNSFLQ